MLRELRFAWILVDAEYDRDPIGNEHCDRDRHVIVIL
jgi:hypothetical protein